LGARGFAVLHKNVQQNAISDTSQLEAMSSPLPYKPNEARNSSRCPVCSRNLQVVKREIKKATGITKFNRTNDWAAAYSSTIILDWIQQIEASYTNPRVWLCPASVSDVLQPTDSYLAEVWIGWSCTCSCLIEYTAGTRTDKQIFNTSTSPRLSGPLHAPLALLPLSRRLGVPHSRSGRFGEERNFLPHSHSSSIYLRRKLLATDVTRQSNCSVA